MNAILSSEMPASKATRSQPAATSQPGRTLGKAVMRAAAWLGINALAEMRRELLMDARGFARSR